MSSSPSASPACPAGPLQAPQPGQGGEEHVFQAPWEASVFALVVALHERGLYSWPQWTEALSRTIARAAHADSAERPASPYAHWLTTLEHLVTASELTSAAELQDYVQAWARAAARTPHGQPLSLRPEDLPSATD